MTTTDKPSGAATEPRFSDPYEVIRDGKTYECRTIEMFGQSLEVCEDGRSIRQILLDLVGEAPWDLSEDTEAGLLEVLDQYRVEPSESPTE